MAKRKDKGENEREKERERERKKGKGEKREREWKRGTVQCEMMHIQFHSKHCFVIDIIYIAPVLSTVTYMKHCYACQEVQIQLYASTCTFRWQIHCTVERRN